jgi:hypothetical protein
MTYKPNKPVLTRMQGRWLRSDMEAETDWTAISCKTYYFLHVRQCDAYMKLTCTCYICLAQHLGKKERKTKGTLGTFYALEYGTIWRRCYLHLFQELLSYSVEREDA